MAADEAKAAKKRAKEAAAELKAKHMPQADAETSPPTRKTRKRGPAPEPPLANDALTAGPSQPSGRTRKHAPVPEPPSASEAVSAEPSQPSGKSRRRLRPLAETEAMAAEPSRKAQKCDRAAAAPCAVPAEASRPARKPGKCRDQVPEVPEVDDTCFAELKKQEAKRLKEKPYTAGNNFGIQDAKQQKIVDNFELLQQVGFEELYTVLGDRKSYTVRPPKKAAANASAIGVVLISSSFYVNKSVEKARWPRRCEDLYKAVTSFISEM